MRIESAPTLSTMTGPPVMSNTKSAGVLARSVSRLPTLDARLAAPATGAWTAQGVVRLRTVVPKLAAPGRQIARTGTPPVAASTCTCTKLARAAPRRGSSAITRNANERFATLRVPSTLKSPNAAARLQAAAHPGDQHSSYRVLRQPLNRNASTRALGSCCATSGGTVTSRRPSEAVAHALDLGWRRRPAAGMELL